MWPKSWKWPIPRKPMKRIDGILFDWDGTLVDTSQKAFAATQNALLDLGIFLQYELYEQIYTPDWHHIYRALGLPRRQWDEADRLWLRHYGEDIPRMGEGDRRTLGKLALKYRLGVVTSANRSRVRREIKALGLAEHFGSVISGDDVQNRKPHPEGLEAAMEQIGKPSHVCCYVGDSPDDIEMGKRAGVRTIGIFSGYPGAKKLRSANPDFCIQNLSQLAGILNREESILP